MKTIIRLLFFSGLFIVSACLFRSQGDASRQWPMYRGYYASGHLDNTNLPNNWDIKSGKNILWKKEIPGLGLSCPVLWDNTLFITTAVSEADIDGLKAGIYGSIGSVEDESIHEWKLLCINKNTGEVKWERTAHKGIPEQKRHPKSTHANSTVATDGNYVVAFFGSEGLYCYDMDGNLIWEKDFGILRSVFFSVESAEWEFASSPLIHDEKVIIQCDVMEDSFLAVYDLASGEEIWKKERDEYPGWCTPNIYVNQGRSIIAVNGYKHRGGYDLQTGEEVWWMSGGGDIPIPTPIIGEDLIYFNSAHGPQSPILAVKKSAVGEIDISGEGKGKEHIEWVENRGGSYMQTMLLYDGLLYNLRWNGSVVCYDPGTGEKIYDEKIGRAESFTASPVASDGKIYLINDEGRVYIIQSGREFSIISENELDDICMVTPAISRNSMFFRTQNYVLAVGNK